MSNKKQIHPVSPGTEVDAELISTAVAQPDHTHVPSNVEVADLQRAITSDEHAGKGGSYTYDPATRTRTRNPEPE